MATTWGDPTRDTFRKKHIREARAAGSTAVVNEQIVNVVARLLEGLSEAHVEVPEEVVSFDPEGTVDQQRGLALHLAIPLPPAPEVIDVVKRWGFDGFQVEGSTMIEVRFVGTPADAERLNDEAVASAIDRVDDTEVSGPSPIIWPGDRDLTIGDEGQDVQFLRLLFAAGDVGAPVDERLLVHVRRFQERRGARVTGLIDADFWRRIIPRGRPLIGQADSGFIIRVLQAALATYEGATTKVSGVWGILTTRDLTRLQKEYNLRVGSFVRAPEWAILLGPVNPRIEAARLPGANAPAVMPQLQPGQTIFTGGLNPIAGLPATLGLVIQKAVDAEDALEKHLLSEDHKPTQHRDGKEPWCNECKLTASGHEPARRKVDPKAPAKKRSTARSAPRKTKTP